MSTYDASKGERAIVDRVAQAVPEGWGAVIVLARRAGDGTEILTGGKGLDKETSIRILRGVLRELEGEPTQRQRMEGGDDPLDT